MDRFETKDLILRKATLSDRDDLFNNYWSQSSQAKYMLWSAIDTLEEAQVRIEKTIEFQKDKFAFVICEKISNRAIGLVGFLQIEEGVYDDCGLGLGCEFTGKGYGTQVLAKLVQVLFEQKGAEKVLCSAFSENLPSLKMQQKCGFKFIEKESKVRPKDGYKYICVVNQITREEYFSSVQQIIKKYI